MITDEQKAAIARVEVYGAGKLRCHGTGFLVTERHLLTAMHVVANRAKRGLVPWGDTIKLRFEGRRAILAEPVEGRWDSEDDWMLLECQEPPGLAPLRLGEFMEIKDWETYGYPAINAEGMVFLGTVRDPCAQHRGVRAIQLYCKEAAEGTQVDGASGAPCIVDGAVVGLLRSALKARAMLDRLRRTLNRPMPLVVAGTLYACPLEAIHPHIEDLLPSSLAVVGKPPLAVPRTLRLEGDGEVHLSLHIKERSIVPPTPVIFPPTLEATDGALRARLREIQLRRTLQGPGALRDAICAMGDGLGEALWGQESAAGRVLGEELAEAMRQNEMLPLALEAPSNRLNLFWETAPAPCEEGIPLGLHSHILLHRRPPDANPLTVSPIPGPLRVLVALGSPDNQARTGELLDLEREVAIILDALAGAMQDGKAFVEVLEEGSLQAIRAALERERFHVLHLTCHGEPGLLILETADGQAQAVTPQELVDAIPAGRGVPLVFLSGASTGAGPLPGFAEDLSRRGVPYVVAMQAPVSAPYATDLAAWFYHHLATASVPEPCRALWEARRGLEAERCERVRRLDLAGRPVEDMAYAPGAACNGLVSNLPEWPVPVIYVGGEPGPLFDPQAGAAHGTVRSFVGRRRERRGLLRVLRTSHRGALLHGIGGVGKSALAAQLVERLVASEGLAVVSLVGRASVEGVLQGVGQYLRTTGMEEDNESLVKLGQRIASHQYPLSHRLDLLEGKIVPQLPLMLLLDGFEVNLEGPQKGPFALCDQDLAMALGRWLTSPASRMKIILTCRCPFVLPGGLERALVTHHLGPLTLAEGRKLMLRLEGLMGLTEQERHRILAKVGGHPLSLEYLDALLRQGTAVYLDIEQRLQQALSQRGVSLASLTYDEKGHLPLDAALSQAVARAAEDVLLDDLLALLPQGSLERRLLFGASVMRRPLPLTDLEGQAVMVEELDLPQEARRDWEKAQAGKFRMDEATLGRKLVHGVKVRPEVREALKGSAEALCRLSLLTREPHDGKMLYSIHGGTARALERYLAPDDLAELHRRATEFWEIQVHQGTGRIDRDLMKPHHMDMVLEAKEHRLRAGDREGAWELVQVACSCLELTGEYGREEALMVEAMGWFGEGTRERAMTCHQLGNIAYGRRDWDRAEAAYGESLEIFKELGDRPFIVLAYHQLGMIAQEREDWDRAEAAYRESLEIVEDLGDRPGIAAAYHQLGMIAGARGDWQRAETAYRESLEINRELGDSPAIARSYYQLANIAYLRGHWDRAEEGYRESLRIKEEVGDRLGMASITGQLGILRGEQGRLEEALRLQLQSLFLHLELQSPEVETNLHYIALLRHHLGPVRFEELVQALTGRPWPESLPLPEVEEGD